VFWWAESRGPLVPQPSALPTHNSPRYPRRLPALPGTTNEEQFFAILTSLHTSLSSIHEPIFILQSLLDRQAIPLSNFFAAQSEMTRLRTLYTAVLARLSRELGPETANAASDGIQQQLSLDLGRQRHRADHPRYPQLAALLVSPLRFHS